MVPSNRTSEANVLTKFCRAMLFRRAPRQSSAGNLDRCMCGPTGVAAFGIRHSGISSTSCFFGTPRIYAHCCYAILLRYSSNIGCVPTQASAAPPSTNRSREATMPQHVRTAAQVKHVPKGCRNSQCSDICRGIAGNAAY